MFALSFILLLLINAAYSEDAFFNAAFWEVKPYIFTNNNGHFDGIIPETFSQALKICLPVKNESYIRFHRKFSSRKDFLKAFGEDSNPEYNSSNQKITFWFPELKRHALSTEQKRKYNQFQLSEQNSLVVIVKRSQITLLNKAFNGVSNCNPILFITFLLAIIFGVLIWTVEIFSNPEFKVSLIQSMSIGFWWSFTLGYGDIVPKTNLGRIISFLWIFIIFITTSIITASITESVLTMSDFNLEGKKIAVLENSFSHDFIVKNYEADVYPVDTYHEILESIRAGDVFAGVMMENVAAWNIEEIRKNKNPLEIIEKIPAKGFIDIFLLKDIPYELRSLFNCMYQQRKQIYEKPLEYFGKTVTVKSIYIESIGEVIKNHVIVQLIVAFTPIILLASIIINKFFRKETIEKSEVDEEKSSMAI